MKECSKWSVVCEFHKAKPHFKEHNNRKSSGQQSRGPGGVGVRERVVREEVQVVLGDYVNVAVAVYVDVDVCVHVSVCVCVWGGGVMVYVYVCVCEGVIWCRCMYV